MSVRRIAWLLGLLVAADIVLLAPVTYWLGWRLPLAEALFSAVAGVLVIGYYKWRWSNLVADYLGTEPRACRASLCVEKVLLLVAGAFLILPGFLCTLVGLVLLLPWVRRLIAQPPCN